MQKLHINNSNITSSQIETTNSNLFINCNTDKQWEEIESIWKEALNNTKENLKLHELVQKANELTNKRDKVSLKNLIIEFFSEFTKDILSGVASETVLKFLMHE